MTTTVRDIEGARQLEIEGDNLNLPGSVFIVAEQGVTYEFDRADFITAVKAEFGLIDPLEEMFQA